MVKAGGSGPALLTLGIATLGSCHHVTPAHADRVWKKGVENKSLPSFMYGSRDFSAQKQQGVKVLFFLLKVFYLLTKILNFQQNFWLEEGFVAGTGAILTNPVYRLGCRHIFWPV